MPEYIHEEESIGKAYDAKLVSRLIKYLPENIIDVHTRTHIKLEEGFRS